MNRCFIIGKIVSNVEFNFLYNSKRVSIARCNIELSNKSIIEIFGYDRIADYLYSKTKIGDYIIFEGKLLKNNIQVIRRQILYEDKINNENEEVDIVDDIFD